MDLVTNPAPRHYLQSPYYFMCCSLYDASEDRPVPVAPSTALAGTLVSSLHRLKDVDNSGKWAQAAELASTQY